MQRFINYLDADFKKKGGSYFLILDFLEFEIKKEENGSYYVEKNKERFYFASRLEKQFELFINL